MGDLGIGRYRPTGVSKRERVSESERNSESLKSM